MHQNRTNACSESLIIFSVTRHSETSSQIQISLSCEVYQCPDSCSLGRREAPTCHSDLRRGTCFAGEHLELFCLVHGVVRAGDDQGVSRPPGLHIVHQAQDGAVYVGVDADRELGPHCNPKQEGLRYGPLPSANMWLPTSSPPLWRSVNARCALPKPKSPGSLHLSLSTYRFLKSTKTQPKKTHSLALGRGIFH